MFFNENTSKTDETSVTLHCCGEYVNFYLVAGKIIKGITEKYC